MSDERYNGILLKIHDAPVEYPLDTGISFHASLDPVKKLWWDGEVLEVMTVKGEIWRLDFAQQSWVRSR